MENHFSSEQFISMSNQRIIDQYKIELNATSIFLLLLRIPFIEAETCRMGFIALGSIRFRILMNYMCGMMFSCLEMLSVFRPEDTQL